MLIIHYYNLQLAKLPAKYEHNYINDYYYVIYVNVYKYSSND